MYTWQYRIAKFRKVHLVDLIHGQTDSGAMTSDSLDRETAQRLGSLLQSYRADLGFSQEKVAIAAGISRQHYQQMEYGYSDRATRSPSNPKLRSLMRIVAILNIPREEVLDAIWPEDSAHRHAAPVNADS
ncbi:XRE family transcriptional regulator [Kocuria sp. HSID16901]|nr:XRE family transcriptional regulator [Kocuria sp. HSID16901]